MSSFQFDPENDTDEGEIITLFDEDGRSLECEIENFLEVEDTTYFLLTPVDTPVVILAWNDDIEEENDFADAILLEDNREIEAIFPDAKAVLAELDLTLKHTAFTLTASGELPPLEDDEILTLDLDPEDSNLEPEELQFLASVYHLEQKYSICTPLSPLLFVARTNYTGELEIISPEDENIQPILEELLFEDYD